MRLLFLAMLCAGSLSAHGVSDSEAEAGVRKLPEFMALQRLSKLHHFAIGFDDDTNASDEPWEAFPPIGECWIIRVNTTVIDDPKTGDAHGVLWNEFLVNARTGEIFVLDRSSTPMRFLTLANWRKTRAATIT